jgi:hypothetical protein
MRDNDRELLMQELRRAHELIHERKDIDAGRQIALRVRAQLAEQGATSAYVEWLLACSYDYAGARLAACEHIDQAFALDPLEPAYNNSRRVVFQNLRTEFLQLDLEKAGNTVAKLYGALADRGQADWDCHLHLARWYSAQKRFTEVKAVLQAVTMLYPGCADAWEGLAALGRDEKDAELVKTAENNLAATKAPKRSRKEPATA